MGAVTKVTKLILKATMVVTAAFSELHIVIPVPLCHCHSHHCDPLDDASVFQRRRAAGEVAKLVKCLSPKQEDGL